MISLFRTGILIFAVAVVALHADEANLTLTVDGVTYSHITFGTVTPLSVTIRHSSGIARIPLESLPAEFQQQLGYDPQKAATYRAAVLAAQAKAAEKETARAKVAAETAAKAKAAAEEVARAKAVAEEAARTKAVADALQARYIRKIGDKLYDFTAVEQLLIQRAQTVTAMHGTHGEEFDTILRQLHAIDNRLKDYTGKYFWGNVLFVVNDVLGVENGDNNGDGGDIDVSNYPNAQQVLKHEIVFAPALWIENRHGKRVFDCGTIAADDEVRTLPITKIESTTSR